MNRLSTLIILADASNPNIDRIDKATMTYGKNSSSNEKTFPSLGFKPETSGFQIGIACNWAI
jgi:hypothetical protein